MLKIYIFQKGLLGLGAGMYDDLELRGTYTLTTTLQTEYTCALFCAVGACCCIPCLWLSIYAHERTGRSSAGLAKYKVLQTQITILFYHSGSDYCKS